MRGSNKNRINISTMIKSACGELECLLAIGPRSQPAKLLAGYDWTANCECRGDLPLQLPFRNLWRSEDVVPAEFRTTGFKSLFTDSARSRREVAGALITSVTTDKLKSENPDHPRYYSRTKKQVPRSQKVSRGA
jgi:hypothetical protein